MNDDAHDEAGDAPEGASAERRSYLTGYLAALALTVVPFAAVEWDLAARPAIFGVIGVAALLQVVVHFRFFLHIRFRGQARDDLQLILFTTLVMLVMAGGTIWILWDLGRRMH